MRKMSDFALQFAAAEAVTVTDLTAVSPYCRRCSRALWAMALPRSSAMPISPSPNTAEL